MSILAFDNVTRTYPGVEAVRGVSLRIDTPQVVGLIGRNGAGKSTLLRMIPPLIHATTGTVSVFDRDPWIFQIENKLRLGYLSDQNMFPRSARPQDVLDLCASIYPTWDKDLVERIIVRFMLPIDRPVHTLSKGQQQQVGLLAAIGHRPELLVLDEPAGGLDAVARRELLTVVIELLADSGSTVLFASHIFSDIERLANRVILVDRGSVLLDRPTDALAQSMCRIEFAPGAVSIPDLRRWDLTISVDASPQRICADLRCSPTEAAERCQATLGVKPADVAALGLEDQFISLTRR